MTFERRVGIWRENFSTRLPSSATNPQNRPSGRSCTLWANAEEPSTPTPLWNMVALIASPDVVWVGQTIGVTIRVTNTTDADVKFVTPLLISARGSGDGVPIGTPFTVPTDGSFQFSWDTATATAGPHILAIQATDSHGASAIIGIPRVTLTR